jgi:hypothetical protein
MSIDSDWIDAWGIFECEQTKGFGYRPKEVCFEWKPERRPLPVEEKFYVLSAAPSGRALALSKVAFVVGDLLECLFSFGFLLVEEAVEDGGKNAF